MGDCNKTVLLYHLKARKMSIKSWEGRILRKPIILSMSYKAKLSIFESNFGKRNKPILVI